MVNKLNLIDITEVRVLCIKHDVIDYLGPVWYMCLKTENCCLKTFVEIHVSEKVCENT